MRLFRPSCLPNSPIDEIDALIDEALAGIDAEGMAAMGPLMGKLKPQLQGRADMGQVSQRVKAKLGA